MAKLSLPRFSALRGTERTRHAYFTATLNSHKLQGH